LSHAYASLREGAEPEAPITFQVSNPVAQLLAVIFMWDCRLVDAINYRTRHDQASALRTEVAESQDVGDRQAIENWVWRLSASAIKWSLGRNNLDDVQAGLPCQQLAGWLFLSNFHNDSLFLPCFLYPYLLVIHASPPLLSHLFEQA
jgi:hypothetical protein